MDSRLIALIVFACVFGSAMLGFFLGKLLPNRHLSDESKDIIKLVTGLVATLCALVLGLLISSAKGTYDRVGGDLREVAARVVMLDRVLARYGPETKGIRVALKTAHTSATQRLISGDESQQAFLETSRSYGQFEHIQDSIQILAPKNDAQRSIQTRALQIANEIASSRWLLTMQRTGSISMPLLMMMVFWLSFIFGAWGVFSPRNLVVATALLACALSVAGAVLLIMEMDRPLSGWIKVSLVPMQKASEHLGE
jgi:hypothetical protein